MGVDADGVTRRAIVEVKGGGVTVAHLRALAGTVSREGADVGVLVSLRTPTRTMRREAADAGFTATGEARLQLLTVEELLAGVRPDLPWRLERRRSGPAAARRTARTA